MNLPQPIQYKIAKKEWEDLYVEVLYTVKHKLGASSSAYAAYTQDLYDYAKETFRMSQQQHSKYMTVAQEEKPPIPVMNATVVEAQGLEAKDPNGFSDPYCMLGIQPDPDLDPGRRMDTEDGFSPERSNRRSHHGGLKKFGASFKRRDRRERSNSESGVLPAKFIRTTSVKAATLNPKWNEKFRLDIDDIRSDRLHLDIWDHDDETSVFDAARKLNEVSNLKGLGRYFKEVAQSARTSIGDNVDDFLGCVNIPLDEVSSAGLDRWFTLQGRSHRSTIQGQIHLKLQLGTREDRGMAAGEDNWREVVEHQQLMWVFVEHELRMQKGAPYEWAGDLPQQALTILHQHAIQGDITELQQSICQWIAYSKKHREVTLDYALLYQLLEELARNWDESQVVLSMDEDASLAESFNDFADHCMELLHHHRDLFPPANSHAWHKLKFMLKCLSFLYSTSAFKSCCPFRNDLHVEITNTLKRGTFEWLQAVCEQKQRQKQVEKNHLKNLINFIEVLNGDLQKAASHYNHLFESTVRVCYMSLVYKLLEKQLVDEISKAIGSQISPEMNASQNSSSAPSRVFINNILSQMPETDTFQLFLVLQEFSRYKDHLPEDEQKSLILGNCHVWFSDVVHHWFSAAKSKVKNRIYNAMHLDKIQGPGLYLKYSTSAMDTVFCFIQLKEFWRQLSWPDKCEAYPFVHIIIQAISSGIVLYCNLTWKRLKENNCNVDRGSIEMSEKVLLSVNNMDHVLQVLNTLQSDLDVESVLHALEKRDGQRTADECRQTLSALVHDTEDQVLEKIGNVINNITEQMRPAIKKFVFHLAWAPEKLDPEKSLAPLIDYLEKNLKTMYLSFLDANFNRLLKSIWKLVLMEIGTTARLNLGKERPYFFDRLSASLAILVEFFHADGKALPLCDIQNVEFQELDQELKLQKSDTAHLIELYYLQRLEDQSKLYHAPFGYLTVNTFFDELKQSVCVEVISARDLIPCDPNGLSDPFVILELVPKHLFPNSSVYKTKTHMKTLHPTFQEFFEWPVKKDNCRPGSAALSFVVMDFDFMRKNDFEGEAYVPLCTLPGVVEDKKPAPVDLVLMCPREKSEILTTLVTRSWDKHAVELLRQEKAKRS